MPTANFFAPGQDAPFVETADITPHDTNDIAVVTRSVFVGVGGDVTLMAQNDTVARLHKNVPSGSILPGRVKRVMATGTTATNLVAWY